MKNLTLTLPIIVFIALISAVSCKQEVMEPNTTVSLLDKKFYKQWFSETVDVDANSTIGELKYTINSSEINSAVDGAAYKYTEETSLLLSNGVYQVEGSSSKGDQFFYIKEGKSPNEILISKKTPNSSFERYCLDSYICMVGIPKSFVFDSWHQLGDSTVAYRVDYSSETLSINYKIYNEANSMMFSDDYFRLARMEDTVRKVVETIYLKQEFGEDSIQISDVDSLHFKTYYRYSGISVGKITQTDGDQLVKDSETSTWLKVQNGALTATYTEQSRTDWTILLIDDSNGASIEIDVRNKQVNTINKGGTRTKISDIESLVNYVTQGVFS